MWWQCHSATTLRLYYKQLIESVPTRCEESLLEPNNAIAYDSDGLVTYALEIIFLNVFLCNFTGPQNKFIDRISGIMVLAHYYPIYFVW
jgi:hypothetical protein